MAKVEKDILIGDLIQINSGVITILMEAGMHCVGCPASHGESIEEAALVHGINPDELLVQINDFLADK